MTVRPATLVNFAHRRVHSRTKLRGHDVILLTLQPV
jgi:hypothetical protein